MNPQLPFSEQQIRKITLEYPTPFHLYDEQRIRTNAGALLSAMKAQGFADFKNYFAVKALPNPEILKILAEQGQGMDCSSLAELELARRTGLSGDNIIFTSNNTTIPEFKAAQELGAIINFDDISHIQPFIDNVGIPAVACCRFNPGNMSFADADESIIGTPAEAKYGMTETQIIEAYGMLKAAGVTRFGLHTMLLSNDLEWHNHQRIAIVLFSLAQQITAAHGIHFEFINLGGGIGVPYKPEDAPFDLAQFAAALREAYDESGLNDAGKPRICMENGRFMTADAGYLVTTVTNRKETYKTYIGVDASMSNLMRPGMYDAYHQVTVLGKAGDNKIELVDVTGSLCENNDKFAVNRELPVTRAGDLLVIHTTGAHGHAMGFQYNGKLRSAELLLKTDGSVKHIRRAETLDDYFATLL